MRVAIVHDDLVQWGGAERVLEGICEIYPEAVIFTSVFDHKNNELKQRFGHKKIVTSFLQKIPGWKKLYKALLPLYPLAFEQFDFSRFDLVISHTTRFAKAIITKPGTTHISYCHTPPRFLWHLPSDKNPIILGPLLSYLRIFDVIASNRVDVFLAGSANAQQRISKIYHRESMVVYPYLDLDRFAKVESFNGGYFVVISRLNSYKKINLIIQACLDLGKPLKIIGKGPQYYKLKNIADMNEDADIEFLGNLDDETTVRVLSGAKALIIAANEDFGLTSLEAQALGKPVLAYAAGGALETVVEGETGLFFAKQEVESIGEVMVKLDSVKIDPDRCKANAQRFSKANFIKNFREAVSKLLN